jgi:chemotaxis protein MotB
VSDRDPRDLLPLDGADGRSDQDLWLISYADLMTLLLAFFVMILAISRVDVGKFERLSREVNPSAEAPLATAQSRIDEVIRSRGLSEVASTTYNESGLSVEVQKNVFFASGRAEVTGPGQALLRDLATVLSRVGPGYEIVVEGHTDDVPIHSAIFRSNWELSTQRAVEVVRVLIDADVPQDRLSAQGFADTRPRVRPQGTAAEKSAARAKNRRVALRVRSRRPGAKP